MTAALLTWKKSNTGNLLAAYRGEVRVGYVCHSKSSRPGSKAPPWTWELSLMKPEGGHYVGRVQSEAEAQEALVLAFKAWMVHAQLREDT